VVDGQHERHLRRDLHGAGAGRPAPTARMAERGGLMIAENSSTPYIP
jgi:hypothetical protein